MEPLIFNERDGRVEFDGFPDEILITPEFLGAAHPAGVIESCIHFNGSNGYAEYHIDGFVDGVLHATAVVRSPSPEA